ncbi:LOW QUALITY PROTEIN: laminin subunit gamma-1 [Plakobranchus ocellatus]|uniref:Laminin subunit gamma-1 n=1 Tax=Plakobranchus ocellatus TaxID=259542 RepID=A0AAV3ZE54_9GAST|nr:LOW QUALITY PROTEIN: laminin subunit gamma-1 [Plakobranchus ocellatus]
MYSPVYKACNCSPQGSTNGACDYTSGQCPCRANIVLASDANSGAVVAGSVSSAGTRIRIDGTCSFCRPNFYGISGGQGCRECGCDPQGSTSLQCNESGQCPCKDSVTGLKCDVCKDGFYGFGADGCTACNCSESGSMSLNCEQTTGTCDCKTNVEGAKCADCKSGFFNLADYNPEGCQPCFCYGHGTTCTSAEGFESVTLQAYNPRSPADYEPLLGDRHTSYSQTIMLWMTAAFTLDISGSVVLSLTGNGVTVQHRARNDTVLSSSSTAMYEVRLLWQEWEKTADAGSSASVPATPRDLLDVLAGLEEVSQLTRFNGQEITTSLISLTSAKPSENEASAMAVTFVEQCNCDPAANVAGLSCEKCATGFRRPTPIDVSSYDTCQACDCNNRGATTPPECDEISGVCLNCRNGTTGNQCELCAGNVIGDECDTCQDEFWGLDTNGCKACNCGVPGSTSTICDKEDGQCPCAANVVGRICDECQENYHDLTASGCVECDSCYGVVLSEIGPLRTQTANLAGNMTVLKANDYTLTIGPFTDRLQVATTNTDALVRFLESAQASENEILTQIASLSSTLDSIETGLQVLELNTTADIEKALTNANSLLQTARAFRTLMENSVKPAYSKVASIRTESTTLSSLVSSLQSVETRLTELAESSSDDQAILDQLSTLNETVATADYLAEIVLQNARAAADVHQTTSLGLLALESRLLSLANKATETLADAKTLQTRSEDTKATRQRLETTLAELRTFTTNYDEINARLRAVRAVASSIQTQTSGESAIFSPTNLQALATVETVEQLTNQTKEIVEQAASWLGRATAAQQKAASYQSEANRFLQSAQSTLDVITNFDEKAADVQARATTALQQVAQLTELSQQVMNESAALTESVVSLGELASQARQASQQALEIISQKRQQLSSITVSNEELSIRLGTLSDESVPRRTAVNEARDNIVRPAQEKCADFTADINSFQMTLLATETNITETLQATSNVTQRANALLVRLRNLASVDSATVVINSVQQAAAGLNLEGLRATLLDLQTKQTDQAAEIARLTEQKNGLQTRLDALKVLRDQILN